MSSKFRDFSTPSVRTSFVHAPEDGAADGGASSGSGGLVGERAFSPAAGSDQLLLGGGGTGSLRRNRKKKGIKAAFLMHGR